MREYTVSLPSEPVVGAVAELLDGDNKGTRFRRVGPDENGWRRCGWYDPDRFTWSHVWWALTEDDSGGTTIKVTIPDPNDPHPRPWRASGEHYVVDAFGDRIPAVHIATWVNKLHLGGATID